MKIRMKRTKKRGMSSGAVLAFVFSGAALCGAVMSMSMSAYNNGGRTVEYYQARALAESAVHTLYAQIRDEMQATGDCSLELKSKELKHSSPGGAVAGACEAKVLAVSKSAEDINAYGTRIRRTTFTFKLEGKGEARLGVKSTMQAQFTARMDNYLKKIETVVESPDALEQMYYPSAPMSSNTIISFTAEKKIKIRGTGGHGHVVANDGIIWKTTGKKSSITAKDVIDIDGQFVVNKDAYDFTTSDNGLGNTNGTKNYVGLDTSGNEEQQVYQTTSRVPFASALAV